MGANKERLQRLEKERLGEERVMNCGLKCKIIEYPNSKHMTVEFENGKIIKDKSYRDFSKGGISDGNRKPTKLHKSLTGKRIGKIVVLELVEKRVQKRGSIEYYYNCKCDCGRTIIRGVQTLKDKNYIKSCGTCPETIEDSINYKHPNMIKYFKDVDDTFRYTSGSGKRVNFICDKCGNERNLQICSVISDGFHCPVCSDSISYPEKFVSNLLRQTNLKFIREKKFDWSQNKRYDFYIPSLSCIIETHGIQHYEESFRFTNNNRKSRSLKEERLNDIYKKEIAISNGIKHYIELDCRDSNMEYIIESIVKSRLSYLIDMTLIDFDKCNEYATSNIVKEVCDIWNTMDNKNIKKISEQLGFNCNTILRYLKIGNDLNWCFYDLKESHKSYMDNSKILLASSKRIKCVELDMEFESLTKCCKYMNEHFENNFIIQGISSACLGKTRHYKNYHFEYLTDNN